MLNQEKSFIKNHYDKLLQALECQLNIAELRKENLKKIISREKMGDSVSNEHVKHVEGATNQAEEIIKTELDHEGNITETTKAGLDHEGNITKNWDVNLNSENLVKVIDNVANQESLATIEKFRRTSDGSIFYDENSNPSPRLDNKVSSENIVRKKSPRKKTEKEGDKMRKSVSQKNIAHEEAARNKCKVLKSEFGLGVVRKSEDKEKPKKNPTTDLERNRRKVLESEYNILKISNDSISVRPVSSTIDFAPKDLTSVPIEEVESSDEVVNFTKVDLQRKPECMDLVKTPEEKVLDAESTKSESSNSLLTASEENASNADMEVGSAQADASNPMQPKSQYEVALVKDAEIFHHKLSCRDIFGSLKDSEVESFSCNDFMKFQRYLQKSALIPLKIQEKLANDALLKHLLKVENLLSHLKSLRGYFFLNDGEFGRSFTYNTFRSLARCTEPQHFFERSNLSNIVNEALNYTIHNCEPNSQNLSFQIVQMPPFLNHSSHDVLSPFELSYRVEWPLNMVLTEKALSKYKMVFRFLLKLKRINWTLNENFSFLNSYFKSKKVNGKVLVGSPHYHKIQIYRHAMTQVMITLDDYIFSSGVQFPWIYFLKDLETTENIDDLYQKHVRYIKDVLTRCFLSKNSEDLLDFIHNLIELALKFHYTAKSSVLETDDEKYEHPKFQVLKTTFNEFCSVLKTFLRTLKEKISSNQVLKSHYVLIEKFDLKLT